MAPTNEGVPNSPRNSITSQTSLQSYGSSNSLSSLFDGLDGSAPHSQSTNVRRDSIPPDSQPNRQPKTHLSLSISLGTSVSDDAIENSYLSPTALWSASSFEKSPLSPNHYSVTRQVKEYFKGKESTTDTNYTDDKSSLQIPDLEYINATMAAGSKATSVGQAAVAGAAAVATVATGISGIQSNGNNSSSIPTTNDGYFSRFLPWFRWTNHTDPTIPPISPAHNFVTLRGNNVNENDTKDMLIKDKQIEDNGLTKEVSIVDSTISSRACDYTNKNDFTKVLLVDSAAAIIAGFTVAPIINFVDTAIFFNAAGKMSLSDAFMDNARQFAQRPIWYMAQPSCLVMAGVYAGTYIVASIFEDTAKHYQKPSAIPQLVGASVSNIGLGVTKDILYTKWFGRGEPRPVPFLSYGCYTVRDLFTVVAAFNLPPLAGRYLTTQFGMDPQAASVTGQLLCPCAVQLVTTPLHLYGIDAYNSPNSTVVQHTKFIKQELLKSTAARVGRIFAAFGMGGVVNTQLRKKGRELVFGQSNLRPILN